MRGSRPGGEKWAFRFLAAIVLSEHGRTLIALWVTLAASPGSHGATSPVSPYRLSIQSFESFRDPVR